MGSKLPVPVSGDGHHQPNGRGLYTHLLGQWLNFRLFGITYLVGKIKFKLFFSGSIG